MFPLQTKIKFSYLIYIAVTICFAMPTIAQAEQKDLVEKEITQLKTTSSSVNVEELTQFIDGYVESMINDLEPPGMMVSVVIGDKKITKGYGLANIETGDKNESNTLFRIGSISKLFVWLSAHMLADEGKLNLDADINEYLGDFSIDEKFGKPITMRDLMSHRSGFDDNLRDFLDPDRDIDLQEAVSRNSPLRVAKPGERASYSNLGSNIAAYIVENISGISFYEFVDSRILKPVGLNSTTLRDPGIDRNDKDLESRMASPHEMKNGTAVKINYMAVRPQEPVGAVAMDANDAAIFMRLLLNQTQYDGGRLLSADAWDRITQPAFDDAVGSDDMGWGFMLNDVDGFATIGHGGATQFLSWMFVIPELDMGVFISSNMNSNETSGAKLAWSIVRRVIGKDSASAFIALQGNPESAKQIAGKYLNNRRPQDRGVSLFGMGSDINVRATDDGYLIFPGKKEVRFAPLRENVWVNKAGGRMRVVRDESGSILRLHGRFGSSTLERITFLSSTNALVVGFGGVLLFSITSLLGMYYRHRRELSVTKVGVKLSWLNVVVTSLWMVFFVVTAIALSAMASLDISEIDNSPFPPFSLKLLFIMIMILCVQTLVHVISLVPIWTQSGWSLWRRINFTTYALVASFAVYLMIHWNLVGGSIYGL
ncbi:MAG: hypothetical protein COA86_07425 [Kangiella sp.]|nr:MAG: hypothetical protein COA86_07425 [Kangiella sp.]